MNYIRVFVPNSIVFITVVTQDRKPILLKNVDILAKSFNDAKQFYDFETIGYVILDDHFHLLLKPKDIAAYPKIIRAIKYNFTNDVGIAMPTYGGKLWQNRYFEHTIIDENDLYKHLDYIHYNPIKHNYVAKAKDWTYSSFYDYVKMGNYEEDWCNLEDKYSIKICNYE